MAQNLVLEDDAANAEADALAALCNNGYLRITDSGDVVLAELLFNSTAFAAAAAGVLTANGITAEDSAISTGVAAKVKAYQSDGTTLLWTGTVGTSDSDLILNSTSISEGATVSVTSLVHTVTKAP